jgi:hypothetical protein
LGTKGQDIKYHKCFRKTPSGSSNGVIKVQFQVLLGMLDMRLKIHKHEFICFPFFAETLWSQERVTEDF